MLDRTQDPEQTLPYSGVWGDFDYMTRTQYGWDEDRTTITVVISQQQGGFQVYLCDGDTSNKTPVDGDTYTYKTLESARKCAVYHLLFKDKF